MKLYKNSFFDINSTLFCILLCLIAFKTTYCQNINTIKFNFENNLIQDSTEFNKLIKNVSVVGIGEGTHGDHESQMFRKTVILNLIRNFNFNIICIEERNKNVLQINKLIHSDSIVPTQFIEQALLNFDYWLWKTYEFVEIIEMLNLYNLTTPNKISIKGVDIDSFSYSYKVKDYNSRDSTMANKIYQFVKDGKKVIYLAHNYHVSFQKDPEKYKWAGEFLKEKLDSGYYSIGILFNSGCFNALSDYGFKTFCEEKPKKINKLSKFFEDKNYNNRLIDFNRINNFSKDYTKFKNNDFNWNIGATYGRYYYKYYKTPSIIDSWDGVFFLNTISESKSFLIPGNYFAQVEITLDAELVNKLTKDSFIVTFKTHKISFDSTFVTEFFMKANSMKRTIYFNNDKHSGFYRIKEDSVSYRFTFPRLNNTKEYCIGFCPYGNGQIFISDFKIIGDNMNNLVFNGFREIKFIGGERFGLKHSSPNEILIFQLKEKN